MEEKIKMRNDKGRKARELTEEELEGAVGGRTEETVIVYTFHMGECYQMGGTKLKVSQSYIRVSGDTMISSREQEPGGNVKVRTDPAVSPVFDDKNYKGINAPDFNF